MVKYWNYLARVFRLHKEPASLLPFPRDLPLPLAMDHFSLVLGQEDDRVLTEAFESFSGSSDLNTRTVF